MDLLQKNALVFVYYFDYIFCLTIHIVSKDGLRQSQYTDYA